MKVKESVKKAALRTQELEALARAQFEKAEPKVDAFLLSIATNDHSWLIVGGYSFFILCLGIVIGRFTA